MKKIDMHFHTTLSDWSRDNNEVIREAKNKWLDFIVATEHDIINSELALSARMNWIKSTSWVEISAYDDVNDKSLHLTCYSDNFWLEISEILDWVRDKRKLKIPKYELSVSKIWDLSIRNKYFLSLAHPNFTFRNDEEWFRRFIDEYQDKLNWIEINSNANREWVNLIIKTSIEYWLILTFWSDSHHKGSDQKHGDLWDMNKYVSEKLIEENFEDFLYELSKAN
jgi:histidinol phosphatase-like PHP family hydrolase